MIRVGITGVPGSGKTSLARGIASSGEINSVEVVSEYARRYISKHGQITSMWEQYRIFQKQKEWEDSVCSQIDVMITDSPIFLGLIYCFALPKKTSKDIMCFNDVFKGMTKLNVHRSRYDVILHLPPVIPMKEDGVRKSEYSSDAVRQSINEQIKVVNRDMFPPILFIELGDIHLEDRILTAINIIKEIEDGSSKS